MNSERIQELKNRMEKADDSFAGEDARKKAAVELLNFADRLEVFAAWKRGRVSDFCRTKAKELRDFVAFN